MSAITTEYAVYVLARRGGLEVAGVVDWSVYMRRTGLLGSAAHTEAAGSEDCGVEGAAHQWLASQGHEEELRGSGPASWQLHGLRLLGWMGRK